MGPPWGPGSGWAADPNAFIFSLINSDNYSFKSICSNGGQKSINRDQDHGPLFGGAEIKIRDIYVNSHSNVSNKKAFSDFGHSYKHPNYPKGSFILAGLVYFKTAEIEVFTKSN